MLFSNRKNAVLFLKGKSLEVFIPGSGKNSFDFPPDVVENQEVLDYPKLEKLVAEFINKLDLQPHQAHLALSQQVYFQKTLPQTDEENDAAEIQKFMEEVPFDPPSIAKKIVNNDGKIFIFAANKNLYYSFITIFEKLNWKISAVVPITAFKDIARDSNLTSEEAEKILISKEASQISNFLSAGQADQNHKKTPTIFFPVIILLTIFGGLAVIVYFRPQFNLQKVQPIKLESKLQEATRSSEQEASPSSTPTATQSATPQLTKEQMKIQILNGSKIEGQAVKVRDSLSALGFKNFTLGNSVGTETELTNVIFYPKVPASIKDEITGELSKLFENVSTQEDQASIEVDVLITTGKPI